MDLGISSRGAEYPVYRLYKVSSRRTSGLKICSKDCKLCQIDDATPYGITTYKHEMLVQRGASRWLRAMASVYPDPTLSPSKRRIFIGQNDRKT